MVKCHNAAVTDCSLHPTGLYWITSSGDSTWAMHDLMTNQVLLHLDAGAPCNAISFHPDGLILGVATDNREVKISDMKSSKYAAIFGDHPGKVSSLCFSESGYSTI